MTEANQDGREWEEAARTLAALFGAEDDEELIAELVEAAIRTRRFIALRDQRLPEQGTKRPVPNPPPLS